MSYVKIWLHCVWGTKRREAFLTSQNKRQIFEHIRENAKDKKICVDFINGHKDHVHCLLMLNADIALSKTMQLIKGESSYWINKEKVFSGKFEWADEYYAVSVSESQVPKVREYIKRQEEHHKIKTWQEEYNEFKEKFGFESFKG
ncbi:MULTISPECIES: IS200/IS605 family transposase [unclassified Saccharicrinis]|uniref:IS200/IS605 family transposase n=1 Tax=unclassified Saccharicrinis TaxID=2646859 RepID=UPI003D346D1F